MFHGGEAFLYRRNVQRLGWYHNGWGPKQVGIAIKTSLGDLHRVPAPGSGRTVVNTRAVTKSTGPVSKGMICEICQTRGTLIGNPSLRSDGIVHLRQMSLDGAVEVMHLVRTSTYLGKSSKATAKGGIEGQLHK